MSKPIPIRSSRAASATGWVMLAAAGFMTAVVGAVGWCSGVIYFSAVPADHSAGGPTTFPRPR